MELYPKPWHGGARIRETLTLRKGGVRQLSNRPNPSRENRPSPRHSKRTSAEGAPVRNRILSQIPDGEYTLLRSQFEPFQTNDYQDIHEPGEKLEYAYFPNRGMVCIVAETSEGKTLEVGIITRAGFAGESLSVEQEWCPYRLVTQPAVEGFRIKTETLRKILPQAPGLGLRLAEYVRFQSLRTAQIAVCNRFHEIEQRLARWLLMSQDRVGSTILPFTHEFLASMLGTGRSSVTLAAGILQKGGMIRYEHGAVKVVNRKKLEEAACECYRTIQQFEAATG